MDRRWLLDARRNRDAGLTRAADTDTGVPCKMSSARARTTVCLRPASIPSGSPSSWNGAARDNSTRLLSHSKAASRAATVRGLDVARSTVEFNLRRYSADSRIRLARDALGGAWAASVTGRLQRAGRQTARNKLSQWNFSVGLLIKYCARDRYSCITKQIEKAARPKLATRRSGGRADEESLTRASFDKDVVNPEQMISRRTPLAGVYGNLQLKLLHVPAGRWLRVCAGPLLFTVVVSRTAIITTAIITICSHVEVTGISPARDALLQASQRIFR